MALALSAVINQARKFLNEYVGNNEDDLSAAGNYADEFSKETDELLRAHAEVAARIVGKLCPLRYLSVRTATTAVSLGDTRFLRRPDGRYMIRIVPDGSDIPVWLRIVQIDVDGMLQPIRTILTADDEHYAMEYSAERGVGSGIYRPRAYSPLGDIDMIEIHSLAGEDGSFGVKISMVEMPKITEVGGIEVFANLSDELLDAVAGQTAALYLSATGDEKANALASLAGAMISTLKMETASTAEQ
ncbi:MAG: hypothetical protein IKM71_01845 [Bacteroidaceae bacterium]|nr:hypothetical protein [Bacteroidaceae bacterium]